MTRLDAQQQIAPPGSARVSLLHTAAIFFRLGATAFGGPAAHIALMEEEFVRRRKWLTHEQFVDHLGATNLIPGPNSTEMAMHIGMLRHGWPGLVTAGCAFIVPAALIVAMLARAYVRYGTLPEVTGVLHGMTPVVVALVSTALLSLGRSTIKTRALALLGLAALVALLSGVHELVVLLIAGMLCVFARAFPRPRRDLAAMLAAAGAASASPTLAAWSVPVAQAQSLTTMFLVFAKIGAVLFGSGYVLIAFLRADFVERLGWLTEQQLLDAVAVGQITPGPLFTTATFVGYLLAGSVGAAVATVGIFLPAFVFVALSGPLVPRLRRSPLTSSVLDGLNVASLAMMAAVTLQLGATALTSTLPIVLAIASAIVLLRYRVNPTWLVLAGGISGWLFKL
jgi:chromate transporter